MNKVILTETQALQLLSYLENSIVDRSSQDLIKTNVMTNYAYEIMWDVADHFGFNLNEGTVDPITLRFRKYEKIKMELE